MQCRSLDGYTLSMLEEKVPYKYVTLSRAIRQLEAMSLIDVKLNYDGTKVICFEDNKTLFWKKVKPLLQTPVKNRYYLYNKIDCGLVSGVNALSYYSNLNPEENICVALDNDTFKSLKFENKFKGLNKYDGLMELEVWKYPPLVCAYNLGHRFVDRLSLYLSLRNNKDPRIEKELDIMLEEMGLKI